MIKSLQARRNRNEQLTSAPHLMEASIQIIIAICIVVGLLGFIIIYRRIQKQNNETLLSSSGNQKHDDQTQTANTIRAGDEDKSNNNGWKCACEGGGIFLPPSLMKNLGGPGAALRLGTGSCYHKQM